MRVAAMLLVVLLNSCETPSQTLRKNMDSWLGQTKAELLRSWGPATRTTSDGDGGEILSWENKNTFGYADGYGNYQRTTDIEFKDFYCDKSGRIYLWRTGLR